MSLPRCIGEKVGMTQVFEEDGIAVPVTVVKLHDLVVTQVKTEAKEGYNAIQVGYVEAKQKHLTKAQQGHFKGKTNFRYLKEFRVDAADIEKFTVGEPLNLFEDGSFLTEGKQLDVTGKSIGKGFQGGTKKWGFGRGPMTHGSKSHRLPGSIGAGTTPGRVFKGTKMARQMGNEKITTQGLRLVKVYPDKKLVLIKGSVPGVEKGFLEIRPSDKKAKVAAS